ncbi:hypothetical protein [Alcaligenes endophyticus]|uniref:Uncharacterized protein n=1 Tax=Alcaligenes endophyticus TaxID=1929088 RepID=A0ABT8EKG4_9BURK|nr:hypothetical protein [Alcaligenes endophyticus]MCX5592015.1 hypothetical protein [Alcaligenes endophyticus]MDN4121705.1 hypothetical protein [Alcaligenes endophyticus]
MDIKQIIEQVFANNMGNRITPELAGGMVRSIAVAIANSMQGAVEQAEWDAAAEASAVAYHSEKEVDDGLA